MIHNSTTSIHDLVLIETLKSEDFGHFGYLRNGTEIYIRKDDSEMISSGKMCVVDAVIYACDIDHDPYSSLGNKYDERKYLAKVLFNETSAIRRASLFEGKPKGKMTLEDALMILSISDEIHKDTFVISERNTSSYETAFNYTDDTINAKYFVSIEDFLSNVHSGKKDFSIGMKGLHTLTETYEYGNTLREYSIVSGSMKFGLDFKNPRSLSDIQAVPEIGSSRGYVPVRFGTIY